MRNASAFPCTSAKRLCCPRVIPLYPGEKRYSNSCSDRARGKPSTAPYRGTVANPCPSTPYRGRSALRCLSLFTFPRCTPPAVNRRRNLTLYGASYPGDNTGRRPRQPVRECCSCPVDMTKYTRWCTYCQPFSQKNLFQRADRPF